MKFSLKQVLIAATLLSVYLALLFGVPHSPGAILLTVLTTCIPSVPVAGVVYGHGYARAFCIGAMGPSLMAPVLGMWFLVIVASDYSDDEQSVAIKLALVGVHAAVLIGGACAAGIRRAYGGRKPSWPCSE